MEINLESYGPEHYESSQCVSGVIKVHITEPWKASEVILGLIGYTKVEWSPDNVYGMFPSAPVTPPISFFEKKTCLELFHQVSDHGKFNT